jgi:hypothetical protein
MLHFAKILSARSMARSLSHHARSVFNIYATKVFSCSDIAPGVAP